MTLPANPQFAIRNPQSTRRDFLRTGTLLAAGAALPGFVPAAARAIEPIKRLGGPMFKYSLAAYSYRNLLTGDKPALKLEDFVDDCAKLNLEGTELTSYYFPADVTPDYLRSIKRRCFDLGLDISGTAIRDDLCKPAGPERDQEIAHVKKWIDYAEILGAPVIRVFSGNRNIKANQPAEEAHRLAVEGLQECCDYAGKHGVYLALENHGGLTAKVDGMLALVRDVKSPWFGVNVDTGNFHAATAYEDLAKIMPYALNVQIKVVMSPEPGKHEPADFSRLAKMVRDANYRGYIVLEYEEKADPRTECGRYIDELRKAFG